MSFLSLLPGDLKQQLQRERMKDVFVELLEETSRLYGFLDAHSTFVRTIYPSVIEGKFYWSLWFRFEFCLIGTSGTFHTKKDALEYLKMTSNPSSY
jgi:hypothetical protein